MREESEHGEQVANIVKEEEIPERKPASPFLRMLLARKVNNTPMPTVSVSSQEIKEEPLDEDEMTEETEELRRNGEDRKREMAPTPDERENGDGGEGREDGECLPHLIVRLK